MSANQPVVTRSLYSLLGVLLISLLVVSNIVYAGDLSARVFKVFDGQTLLLRTRQQSQRVRLVGIQTPDVMTTSGQLSQKVLEKMVLGRRVSATTVDASVPDLPAVLLLFNGKAINQELLKAGYARVDPRLEQLDPDLYRAWMALEGAAREDKLGLWKNHPSEFL